MRNKSKRQINRRERELVKELREEGRSEWQETFLSVFKKNFGYLGKTLEEIGCTRSRYQKAIEADPRFYEAIIEVKQDLLDQIESFLVQESLKDPQVALKVLNKLRKEVWGDQPKRLEQNSQEVDFVEVFEFKGNKLSFPKKKK